MTEEQTLSAPLGFLGIDGGGSKTLAILVDEQGRELGRGQAGSANYANVGLEQAKASIYQAVAAARAQAPGPVEVRNAWIGLAGIDTPQARHDFTPHLRALAPHVLLTNDAELGLSALPQAVGIVLIAGTGSIALGRDLHGNVQRSGGWGHILGDEGSGYALGQQALQAVVRAVDGRGPATTLMHRILEHWQLTNPYDLISHIYPLGDKAMIAQLSTRVLQAAREGDVVAKEIIRHAAEELALAVSAVYKKLDFAGQPLAVALCGGLLIHEGAFRQQVIEQLGQRLTLGEIALVDEPARSAAQGASNLTSITHWQQA